MRILFTTLPESGHFRPLIPIAQAAADAGHDVAFASPACFTTLVEQAGFRAFPAGFDHRASEFRDIFTGLRKQPETERAGWFLRHIWIGMYAAVMAPDLLSLARSWP